MKIQQKSQFGDFILGEMSIPTDGVEDLSFALGLNSGEDVTDVIV